MVAVFAAAPAPAWRAGRGGVYGPREGPAGAREKPQGPEQGAGGHGSCAAAGVVARGGRQASGMEASLTPPAPASARHAGPVE